MDTKTTLVGAVIVAVIGILGQFYISNRRFIPELRDERVNAYVKFLSACKIGLDAIGIEHEYLEHVENETNKYTTQVQLNMEEHVSERLKIYNSEMAEALPRMQIICPQTATTLGDLLTRGIADYREDKTKFEAVNTAYSNYVAFSRRDLSSLAKQSKSLKRFFATNIKEIYTE